MSDAWQSYPGAPEPGAPICHLSDLPDHGALPFDIGDFPVLLVKTGDDIRAFVNACPHQFLPLTYKGGAVLSSDGARLICSNHDAQFDSQTGAGISGFGHGCELDPLPICISKTGEISIK